MMQLESWQETSLAMALENDTLKLRLFAILNKLNISQRCQQQDTIQEALAECGFTDHEIQLYINGNLRLGE